MYSEAVEDYLKAIYKLQHDGQRVSTSALARHMRVTPASVTGMLRKLAQLQLVAHEPYRGAALTMAGRQRALAVIRRHRLAETFLFEKLGVPRDEVHAEAHRWEHVISGPVAQRLDSWLGHPAADPHGSPIPTPEGQLSAGARRPLAELEPGDCHEVAEISDHDPALLRYLGELGLLPGAMVEVLVRRPFAGPVTLRVNDRECTVGPEVSRHVFVAAPDRPAS